MATGARATIWRIAFDREADGRWIAELAWTGGSGTCSVLAYGATQAEAAARAALAAGEAIAASGDGC